MAVLPVMASGAPLRALARLRPLPRVLGAYTPRILSAGTEQFTITKVEVGVPSGGVGPPQYTITAEPQPPGPALYDMQDGYSIRVTVLNQGNTRNYFQAVASDRVKNVQSDVVWLDPGQSDSVILGNLLTDKINQDGSYTFSQVKVEWYDAASGTYPKGSPWEWRALQGSGPSTTPISGSAPPQGGGPPVTGGPAPGTTGPPTVAPPAMQPPTSQPPTTQPPTTEPPTTAPPTTPGQSYYGPAGLVPVPSLGIAIPVGGGQSYLVGGRTRQLLVRIGLLKLK